MKGASTETFAACVLLERLCQIEALLHVVVAGSRGVDIPDAAVASLHFTVLLQGLGETTGGMTSANSSNNQALYLPKISLNLGADFLLNITKTLKGLTF